MIIATRSIPSNSSSCYQSPVHAHTNQRNEEMSNEVNGMNVNDLEVTQDEKQALERWLIREAVRRQVKTFLGTKHRQGASILASDDLMAKVMLKLTDFPPFRDDSRMQIAIQELFKLSPKLDASLKARRGTLSVESFFVGLISGPVVSSARATNRRQGLGEVTPASSTAADGEIGPVGTALMEEIFSEEDGVKIFLEEIKTAHTIGELRPSFQAFFAALANNWTMGFLHNVRRKPQELRDNFRRLPRHLILAALKLHAGDRATSAAVSVLFTRPFGVMSFWQRFVAEAVNLSSVTYEFERLQSFVPPEYQNFLIANEEELLTLLDIDSPAALDDPAIVKSRLDTILNFLKSRAGMIPATDPEKWAALRFVELRHQLGGLESLVEVVGTNEFSSALRTIFSSSKSKLSDSLLARGSGFVKFVEEFFDCIEASLDEATKTSDDDALAIFVKDRFSRVLFRAFSVLHNVLSNDPKFLVHETIQWIIGAYQSAKMIDLPSWESLQSRLTREDAEILKVEAKQVRNRETANLRRQIGSVKSRVPSLNCAGKLVGLYIETFHTEIDAFSPKRCPAESLLYTNPQSNQRNDLNDPIVDVEVCWSEHQVVDLARRGFVMCGHAASASVWVRTRSRRGRFHGDCREIDVIEFVNKFIPSEVVDEWVTIPRNLNKGSIGNPDAFIRYKRAPRNHKGKFLLGMRMLDSMDDSNRTLNEAGWRNVSSIRSSFLFELRMWCHYA